MTIEMADVSAEYRGSNGAGAPVLSGVSLTVRAGEVVGVIGPNGAGKSTLLKLLTRQLEPRSGHITLGGRPLQSFGRFELARHLAVVPQTTLLPAGFRVWEVVAMGRTPHLGLLGALSATDMAVVEGALTAADLHRFAQRRVETLSGGEQQRVVFARALAQQARFLLLDEPTNHMDLRYQVDLMSYARHQAAAGAGVLVVLHDLNLAARTCHWLVVLNAGRVHALGQPAEVLTTEIISDVFGAAVRVLSDGGTPVVVPRLG